MVKLTVTQKESMLLLLESLIDNREISDDLLVDPIVFYELIRHSQDDYISVYQCIKRSNIDGISRLTMLDVISEEFFLDLHVAYGFKIPEISQWLRGLSHDAIMFFVQDCKDKDLMFVDQVLAQARSSFRLIEGVYIESITAHFNDLETMVKFAQLKRCSFKQFQFMLHDMQPSLGDVQALVPMLVDEYKMLSKITNAGQLHNFRIFCGVLDFLDQKDQYLMQVSQVFDQLINTTSIPKAFAVLDTMPYQIIEFVLNRLIAKEDSEIITHLCEQLPIFTYGSLRKIVRRGNLGLNYKYE